MGESVKILLLDVDGVLTDGKVYVAHDGERFKAFNSRDNRAIAEFIARGWEVHLVSASKWPGLKQFSENTGAQVWPHNSKTLQAIHEITRGQPYVAVGDDVFDVEMLDGAETAFVPADCDPLLEIQPGRRFVLESKGGQGVVAELARRYFGGR